MPDKLTDAEIVKALECCIDVNGANCHECPYDECCSYPKSTMLEDALDLFNRLQAENEVLKARIGVYETCNARKDEANRHLEAENERLKATVDSFTDIGKLYSEIKAEAYKEFAELLHCQCENIINQPHNENVRPISWKVAYEEFDKKVDNLLKNW